MLRSGIGAFFGLSVPNAAHQRAITRRQREQSHRRQHGNPSSRAETIPEDSEVSAPPASVLIESSVLAAQDERAHAMERRISSLEELIETMQGQLEYVMGEMTKLEEAGLAAPKSKEHTLKLVLARHTPHHRTALASKEEIILAARWSQIAYYTNANGGDSLTPDAWNELIELDVDARKARVTELLEPSATPAAIARMAESALLHADMHFVAHEESGAHFDGQVSTWRSDERKLLVIAWRGTDSYASAKLDAYSGFRVPWHTKEVAAAARGNLVGVVADPAMKHLAVRAVDDESASPLPHHGLLQPKLMVGKGFLTQYLGERLSVRVKALVSAQLTAAAHGYEVLITGHSLGGAVATLCAYELAATHLKTPILLITFGSPRTVNSEFANVLARLPNLTCYRVANGYDVVPRVPPSYLDFQHVGRTVWLHAWHVQPPRRFGTQPWQLAIAPISCTVKTGVADHSVDLYLDRLCGVYSWSRYQRVLSHQHRAAVGGFESRAVTAQFSFLLRKTAVGSMLGLSGDKAVSKLAEMAITNNVDRHSRYSARSSASRSRAASALGGSNTPSSWRSVDSNLAAAAEAPGAPSGGVAASSGGVSVRRVGFTIEMPPGLPPGHHLRVSASAASSIGQLSSAGSCDSVVSEVGMAVAPAPIMEPVNSAATTE